MLSRRIVIPVGTAAGLVGVVAVATATTPFTGAARQPATDYRLPIATISGGAVSALVYPSLVSVRLDRAEAALHRAEGLADQGKPVQAAAAVKQARAQANAAWAATKYVIQTTPPPPPPVDDRANSSGAAPAGGTYAAPPDTGLAVFSLQHDVVSTSVGLVGSNATLNATLTATIRAMATARNTAVTYIHSVAPPPPPVGDRAGASGGAIASDWSTTMPSVLPLLDDEMQQLNGARTLNKALPAAVKTTLKATAAKDKATEATINQFWPPVVGDG
jgi:hypothetical protein